MFPVRWRELAPSASEALAMAVRDAVLDGKIRVADHLPAERRLASQLGVSRGTVVAAFARLRAEGWLSTRHGSGSTVQIPASLRLRYEPLPEVHTEGLIDLRRAMPAAPVDAYTGAAQRALGRATRLLLGIRAPARLIRQLLLHPLCQVCSPPPIEQLTACELLPELDGLLRQRTRELRSQRDRLAAALRHDGAWTFTP